MDRPSAPSPPAAPPEVRDVELGEIIGTGSSGTVYRGHQPRFHRDVAVKVVASHGSPSAAERWDRELSAMGRLSNHPNILPVYAGGVTEEGSPYLVMPYVPDGTLRDRLRDQGPMPPAVVASIGAKLAGALAMAHQAGVLHRDVKPENVLMSPYGEPQLADFGIARLLDATLTAAGTVTATIPYAAPEVLEGAPATEAADVYGLGATLHACLTGEAPFVATEHDTMVSLVTRVATQDPPSLRAAGVPAALADVVGRAMAKDPAARHASAAELQRDLDDAATRLARIDEEPAATAALPAAIAATTTMERDGGSGLAPTAVVAAPAAATAGTRAAPSPRSRPAAADGSRRWTTFLVALVALAAMGATGWWLLADGSSDDTATADRGPVEVEEATPDDAEPPDTASTTPPEDAADADVQPEPAEPAGTSGDAVSAAIRYFETLDAGDLDGAWALTTMRFRDQQDRSSWAGFWSGFRSIDIVGEPRPAGDGAVIVPLSLDGQREDYRLLLLESDGVWLVDGPTGG
jgi:serine/threonine-protein kinase PknK